MEKVNLDSSYYPPNIAVLTKEWSDGAIIGEPSGISELDKVFKWMRGFQNGWYGWSNDGKGEFTSFLNLVKAKRDNWKFCLYKQEDMSSFKKKDGTVILTASDIYNSLVWALTGITPYDHIAKEYRIPKLEIKKYHDAMDWVEQHFFVIYPKDRRFKNIMDNFRYFKDKFNIDSFWIDPFKAMILDGRKGSRDDQIMTDTFYESKEFAMETNTNFNYINHAKSMVDQKEKDGSYKVVNQFMQLGGSAWDICMDGQYTIYRPLRHKDPNDPNVMFRNLKQRKQKIVGCKKGDYDKIVFDDLKNRYYFNGICPLDGSLHSSRLMDTQTKASFIPFDKAAKTEEKKPEPAPVTSSDDCPF